MKKINFMGWSNCLEMSSGAFRLILTTEIGPRIIGALLKDGQNLFYVDPDRAGKSGGNQWHLYGGHRLWHAPEAKPRTYEPDNAKVKGTETRDGLCLSAGVEKSTGIYKSLTIKALGAEKFRIIHKLRNDNLWNVELAAWALSVMAPGGVGVVPQPQGDKTALLPNRYLTVWPYTNMADSRLTWGDRYILLRQDAKAKIPCKFGINCEDGWIAYVNRGQALVKSFEHLVDAEYPDNGCSIEAYTCPFMLEIETLSPLYNLEPGEELVHVETWQALDKIGKIAGEKDADQLASKFFPRRSSGKMSRQWADNPV